MDTAAGTTIGSNISSAELLATIEVSGISNPNAVPEPGTFAIWGMLALLGAISYRKKNAQRR